MYFSFNCIIDPSQGSTILVDLSHSNLEFVPTYHIRADATTVNLQYNYIVTVPTGSLQHLSNVQELQLQNNRIQTMEPGALVGMYNLQALDLSNNNLKTLSPSSLTGPKALKSLILSHNDISHLKAGLFDSIGKSLIYLALDSNNLVNLPAGVFRNLPVKILELQNNDLTILEEDVFSPGYTASMNPGMSSA